MPLLRTSNDSPFWLPDGHFQSIYPSVFRKVANVSYVRERIVTPDNDFLDLDWSFTQKNTEKKAPLVILSHGLEGNSTRQYILGMVRMFVSEGYDCLAWNFRSCSGEMNLQPRFYHSGATEDLDLVVQTAMKKGYETIYLTGFSLGGNLTLKYLGESGKNLPSLIRKAAVFSVPMDLKACSIAIEKPQNWIYLKRFLNSLKPKITSKGSLFPEHIDARKLAGIKTFYEFDDTYTAGLHGFDNADHYYAKCSSCFFVDTIAVPTLIVNAVNDPIVPPSSLPEKLINSLPNVWLELTERGGHCGFRPQRLKSGPYWSESRALSFFNEHHF